VLQVPLDNVSLKVRSGPPVDEEADLGLPYWAGLLPLSMLVPGAPVAAPDLPDTASVPGHVTDWTRESRRLPPS
jgi:uncharacterized protein